VSTPELASVRVMSPTTRPPAEPDRFESERSKAERERIEARQLDRDLWTIVGHMASALLVYGGIGYLLARWLHHPILLLVGLVFGLVLSLGYTLWLANRGGRLHR
jgi:F0F1-type ATP synthase assembly protein I